MSVNLAEIPVDWLVGSDMVAPTYVDNTVLHNGHASIRMEKGDGTKSREIWQRLPGTTDWLPIKPGDHIVFKVWMKTAASSIGDTTPTSGIRIGIDFYDSNYISGSATPDGKYWTPENGYPTDQYLNYVNWARDWEQRTMNFIIQNQYPSDISGIGGYTPGQLRTPTKIIPWVQVWSGANGNADNSIAWFADAELYVNPATVPIPTATTFTFQRPYTDGPVNLSLT